MLAVLLLILMLLLPDSLPLSAILRVVFACNAPRIRSDVSERPWGNTEWVDQKGRWDRGVGVGWEVGRGRGKKESNRWRMWW